MTNNFCINCGVKLDPKSTFCNQCGRQRERENLKQPPQTESSITSQSKAIQQPKVAENRSSSRPLFTNQFKITKEPIRVLLLSIVYVLFLSDELYIFGIILLGISYYLIKETDEPLNYVNSAKSMFIFVLLPFAIIIAVFPFAGPKPETIIPFALLYIFAWVFTPPDEIKKQISEDNDFSLMLYTFGTAIYIFNIFPWSIVFLINILFVMLIIYTNIELIQKYKIRGGQLPEISPTAPQIVQATSNTKYQIPRALFPLDQSPDLKKLDNKLNLINRELGLSIDKLDEATSIIENQLHELTQIIEQTIPQIMEEFESKLAAGTLTSQEIIEVQNYVRTVDHYINEHIKIHQIYSSKITESLNQNIVLRIQHLQSTIESNQVKLDEMTHRIDEISPMSKAEPVKSILEKLESISSQIQTKATPIATEVSTKTDDLHIAAKLERDKIIEERVEITRSFRFRSLISERQISNSFAYIGALFLILSSIFGLNYSYQNYILPNFPRTAPFDKAAIGLSVLYILAGIILAIPPLIFRKFSWSFPTRITISIGILFVQLNLFVQTFYFESINDSLGNTSFVFLGFILSMLGLYMAFILRSHLVGLFSLELGMWVLFVTTQRQFINSWIISFLYGIILASVIYLTLKKALWLTLASYSLFAPIIWFSNLQNGDNVAIPEVLSLIIAFVNVGLVVSKKMPTPKPFAHFMGTLFLIYPNLISVWFALIFPDSNELGKTWRVAVMIVVFATFFALYWIYVFYEETIEFSMNIPVSYKFKEEELRMKNFYKKLNWMMLFSVGILLFVVINLVAKDVYSPIIYFGVLLSITGYIGIKKNIEKFVSNSILLIFLEAELFYFISFVNPNAEGAMNAIVSGVFLISLLSVLNIIALHDRQYSLARLKISSKILAIMISIFSVINFTLASISIYEALVISVAILTWFALAIKILRMNKLTSLHLSILHLIAFGSQITIFLGGLLRISSKFRQDDVIDHIFINLPFVLSLAFVYYLIRSSYKFTVDEERVASKSLLGLYDPNRLYIIQIILFLIPNALIIYGQPYFFFPEENQGILMVYLLIYFFSMPILYTISQKGHDDRYSILASFGGFYSFVGAFLFLGGVRQVYVTIVKPIPTNVQPRYLIPLEWAIYAFILVSIITIAWTLSLSRKSKYDLSQLVVIKQQSSANAEILGGD